ncbi:hypothetical protein BJ742DRAFT_893865 [Cladochytrium replicatum]|nr:hypothetical protein BJ742DRAFT_893865 [Cladochytrium replicatum]
MSILQSYVPPSDSLANKTVLITGGSSGIGKWNVKQFAQLRRKRLFVLGRNAAKTNEVIDAVRKETGFDGMFFVQCDNANLASVRHAVKTFLEVCGDDPALHLLVCNAGTALSQETPTEDGFEVIWQSNYLSHFLLIELLLPTLKKTAEKEGWTPGAVRILNVSSIWHRAFKDIDFNLTRRFKTSTPVDAVRRALRPFKVIDTKRRARELQRYGINVYSLHPGAVATEIFDKAGISGAEAELYGKFLTEEEGSLTTLYVSTSDDELVVGNSGAYFDEGWLGLANRSTERKDLQHKLKEKSFEDVTLLLDDGLRRMTKSML